MLVRRGIKLCSLFKPEKPMLRMPPFDIMSKSFKKALALEKAKARTWLNVPVSIAFCIIGKLPNVRE